MKKSPQASLWSDVSILIVATLIVSTLLRGAWQFWMLIAVFAIWSVSAVWRHLIPALQERKARQEAHQLRMHYEQTQVQENKPMPNIDIDISEPASIVLLRHVNHRISAHLQAAYPKATWEWCSDDPERIVTRGGTGRIRLHGAEDYNFAEISLDQNATIGCQLLKVVPLAGSGAAAAGDKQAQQPAAKPREIDPQVWYEKKGKLVLTNLIADLNSRGHNTLTILEDGSISIKQADKDIKRSAFESVPERTYWPRLVKVLEREGIASSVTAKGIVLNW